MADKGSVLKTVSNFLKLTVMDKPKSDSSYLKGSISEYTKDLVMTFPLMCDNSLPATTASMISKASERNIVTMLELMFASMQLNGTNGAQILSKLHQNIKTDYDMYDVLDALEKVTESVTESVEIRDAAKAMVEYLKTPQKSYPISSFSETSLNNYLVHNVYGKTIVKEAGPDPYADRKEQREEEKLGFARNEEARKAAAADREADKDIRSKVDSDIQGLHKVLLDQDVKKANELTPTLMIIKYNEEKANEPGTYDTKSTFIAGVKSRIVSVDSMDIVDRVIAKNKTKLSFLNFIRATTGEIRFIPDFLLCLNQAKIDSKNSVKKGPAAKMWKVLETRSAKNNKSKLQKAGNDASAITTLVINQETVNVLKKQYDFDLENIKNAKMVLDAYNLLAIVICDESIDVAKFLYAGNDSYEPQAYSFLEREGKDSSYKKVINLLNTTGR